MIPLIQEGVLRFARETGILAQLERYETAALWVLAALGLLLCLAGIRVYRACCAGLLFLLTAALTCVLLRDRAAWREVVTCFSVLGVTLSFLALFWNRLDACLICAAIGGCAGWLLTEGMWGAMLLGLTCLILTLTFPVETLRILTAAMGSRILWEAAAVGGWELPWPVMIPTAALGYLVQRLSSRRQMLFKKARPDWVTYWWEERKRRYAHGISKGN